jgi:hypothetical protein
MIHEVIEAWDLDAVGEALQALDELTRKKDMRLAWTHFCRLPQLAPHES